MSGQQQWQFDGKRCQQKVAVVDAASVRRDVCAEDVRLPNDACTMERFKETGSQFGFLFYFFSLSRITRGSTQIFLSFSPSFAHFFGGLQKEHSKLLLLLHCRGTLHNKKKYKNAAIFLVVKGGCTFCSADS